MPVRPGRFPGHRPNGRAGNLGQQARRHSAETVEESVTTDRLPGLPTRKETTIRLLAEASVSPLVGIGLVVTAA